MYIYIFLGHVVVWFADLESVLVFTFLPFCDECLGGTSVFVLC